MEIFAKPMLQADDEQIVKNDYKVFDFAKKTMINQVETVEQDYFLSDTKSRPAQSDGSSQSRVGCRSDFHRHYRRSVGKYQIINFVGCRAGSRGKAFGGTTANQVLDIGPRCPAKEIAPTEKALA